MSLFRNKRVRYTAALRRQRSVGIAAFLQVPGLYEGMFLGFRNVHRPQLNLPEVTTLRLRRCLAFSIGPQTHSMPTVPRSGLIQTIFRPAALNSSFPTNVLCAPLA